MTAIRAACIVVCSTLGACGVAEVDQPVESVELDGEDGSASGNESSEENADSSSNGSNGDETASGNENVNADGDTNDNENHDATGSGNANDNAGDPPPVSTTQFVETDGYVVMEMESASLSSTLEWDMRAELTGYTGDGYYQFMGNGICNGPPNSPLEFTFNISAGGRYELRLRAAKFTHCVEWKKPEDHVDDTSTSSCDHAHGTCNSVALPSGNDCPDPTTQCRRSDISNDAFVQIRDSNDQYVPFVNQPASSIGSGIKLFGGNNNQWGWTGKSALDTNDQKWTAHWDLSPGDYTLIIEGRSQMFRIDRMVLFDEGRNNFSNTGFTDRSETLAP